MSVWTAASIRGRSRRRRDLRGAVALEFALVLGMLVTILVGTVTTGYSYSHALDVTNAVREGARFGATDDVSAPPPANWVSDVIARTRQSQFDDDPNPAHSDTAICVQLLKAPSTVVASGCDQGDGSVQPALTTLIAPDVTAYPAVPPGLSAGTCVVRVLAARKYSISLVVLPSLDRTLVRGSVARYERDTC